MSDRNEIPAGEGANDNDYVSRPGQKEGPIPVVANDEAQVEGVMEGDIDPEADSDAQLERDDAEAIDESNIVEDRTRGAGPQKGGYREPGDEEGLPSNDGRSSN